MSDNEDLHKFSVMIQETVLASISDREQLLTYIGQGGLISAINKGSLYSYIFWSFDNLDMGNEISSFHLCILAL